MPDSDLEPPTVEPRPLVVGGASGIGAAVVDAFRRGGPAPVVWDVREPHDVACDVSDPTSVDEALSATVARFGPPSSVTVTAGIGHSGLLLDESTDAWDAVMACNARGPLLVMRAVARHLSERGLPGSIVVTSSVSAHLVDRAMGLYCASKAALDMLVRVAAAEWAPLGIRVNAVAPGVTETPMLGRAPTEGAWLTAVASRTALGRLGQPGDIAETVLALHSLQWVTGQILDCDGGLSLYSPIDAFGSA
jgi:NAD(P)-dependent dehydrogenase (short-subunit alcohol dehydrogenase family)